VKTNDLIDQLGADLAPVARLARPGRRAILWLAGSFLYLAGMLLAVILATASAGPPEWDFVGSQLLGAVAGGLAALAAFSSVVPGHSNRALLAAAVATAAWLVSFAALAFGPATGRSLVAAQHEWICTAMILAGGAPLVAALAVMLKRGAPINPMLSGLLTALAVGLLANFTACISSPHPDVETALFWHVGTLGVLIVLCVPGSRFVLSWGGRRSKDRNRE
jgi:hypothetical protein